MPHRPMSREQPWLLPPSPDALAPGTVDEAFKATLEPLQDLELVWPNAFNAHAPSGAKGDARKGTREAGERLIESSIDELAEILDHLHHSPRWNGPPRPGARHPQALSPAPGPDRRADLAEHRRP